MTPRNNRLHWILAICLAANSGCTSIRTSQLFRTSDGKFASYSASKGTKGVPCKLKVETGVRAHIRETYFIKKDSKEAVTTNGGRIYSIDLTPIYSDQVFMVHIPRPFAGTLNLTGDKGYKFKDGYLTSIGGEIEDKTIEDVTAILGDKKIMGSVTKTMVEVNQVGDIEAVNRTVAVRDFSYGDPNWNLDLNEWANQFNGQQVSCNPPNFRTADLEPPQVPRKLGR